MSFEYAGDAEIGDLIVASTLPSDGDDEDVASVNVALEALLDDMATIRGGNFSKTAGTMLVHGGIDIASDGAFVSDGTNVFTSQVNFIGPEVHGGDETHTGIATFDQVNIHSGATLFITSGAFEVVSPGGALVVLGTASIGNGGSLQVAIGGTLELEVGCIALVDAGAVFDVSGTAKFESGGLADFRSGADAVWRSGAVAEFKSGATLQIDSGADYVATIVGGSVSYDATTNVTDSSTTLRAGQTFLVGSNAQIGWRVIDFDNIAGRPNGDQNATFGVWQWDFIFATTLTANRTWRMSAPPGGIQALVTIINNTGSTLTLKDDGTGTPLGTLPATGTATCIYSDGSNGVTVGWTLAGP